MPFRMRKAAVGVVVLAALGGLPAHAADCPAAPPFAGGLHVIEATRVYTNAAGVSDFAPVTLKADGKAYFKPGELFYSLSFGAATKVQIVAGPANVVLPQHPSPGYEMFLTIQGQSVVTLPDGREKVLVPGSLVIMDDMASKTGHGGRSGPCGYVAVQIVPANRLP